MTTTNLAAAGIEQLLEIMVRLRNPNGGCPWDVEQTFATIAPYTIEESYEVADAIERGDMVLLKEELGDLLFQVVFHAQIAHEAGLFTFAEIVNGISDKMVRRHPHVFGDSVVADSESQLRAWEGIKAAERAKTTHQAVSALDGIATTLPAITRAHKLGSRAARVGFDFPDVASVFDKIAEETRELAEEVAAEALPSRLTDEVGDLLFSCVNLARALKVDPETALRHANAKFERRFRALEVATEHTPAQMAQEKLDDLWNQIKATEAA